MILQKLVTGNRQNGFGIFLDHSLLDNIISIENLYDN
jgi:hypothetical protein